MDELGDAVIAEPFRHDLVQKRMMVGNNEMRLDHILLVVVGTHLLDAPVVLGVADGPLADDGGAHDGRSAGGAAQVAAVLLLDGPPNEEAQGVPSALGKVLFVQGRRLKKIFSKSKKKI